MASGHGRRYCCLGRGQSGVAVVVVVNLLLLYVHVFVPDSSSVRRNVADLHSAGSCVAAIGGVSGGAKEDGDLFDERLS